MSDARNRADTLIQVLNAEGGGKVLHGALQAAIIAKANSIDDAKDESCRRWSAVGPQRGEIYRHYKGGLYVVLERAIQEDTLEPLVIYQSHFTRNVMARTLANFTETVAYAANNPDGPCPRFRKIDP